ncbi:citramalate synthase [Acidiferrimicrobium sp. IK]|uniref:citramalate synthase n=1 Tax=Acidiferrimicrobium sp. IK TaxID=2871700 RepID=UPI0021CB83C1|nr:citramalate synthase [Acidiferrimicrobium sp. IK]MCU4184309.1 citramalate synthase [Acidiferrimicrobium sp. IK]
MSESHSHAHSVPRELPERVDIYDTTLRDGSQQEGLSLTVDDKLRVAEQLDHLGVQFIEGGWPGANPKDEEFFRRAAAGELHLHHATLVAFGSTRKAGGKAETDPVLANLLEARTPAVCLVAKSAAWHVTETLRTTLTEAVDMVADSVAYLRAEGRRVFLDAEHFFDGYRDNPAFSLDVLRAAESAGAEVLVLCDTNGGSLPFEVERVVGEVRDATGIGLGCHFHNDSGCAVANSLIAVRQGVTQVQGCVNGYGERTGNADLSAAVPDLTLKMGVETIGRERLGRLTGVAHHIAELVNVSPDPHQPFVGTSAFAHKAGLHTSAIVRSRQAYEHVDPDEVGNGTRFVVSEMAGRSTIALKAEELGLDLDGAAMGEVVEQLKDLEHRGYHFEVADGSLELLMRRATGWKQELFRLESHRVVTDLREDGTWITEATIKVHVGDERVLAVAEGNGPVNALDAALRKAIGPMYPVLSQIHLTDFKVRVLDSAKGTGSVTRVLIDSTDGERTWTTIGVSENVIEASWAALEESIVYGLLNHSAS